MIIGHYQYISLIFNGAKSLATKTNERHWSTARFKEVWWFHDCQSKRLLTVEWKFFEVIREYIRIKHIRRQHDMMISRALSEFMTTRWGRWYWYQYWFVFGVNYCCRMAEVVWRIRCGAELIVEMTWRSRVQRRTDNLLISTEFLSQECWYPRWWVADHLADESNIWGLITVTVVWSNDQ